MYCFTSTFLLFDEQINETCCIDRNVLWNYIGTQAERLKKLEVILFEYRVHVETVCVQRKKLQRSEKRSFKNRNKTCMEGTCKG